MNTEQATELFSISWKLAKPIIVLGYTDEPMYLVTPPPTGYHVLTDDTEPPDKGEIHEINLKMTPSMIVVEHKGKLIYTANEQGDVEQCTLSTHSTTHKETQ